MKTNTKTTPFPHVFPKLKLNPSLSNPGAQHRGRDTENAMKMSEGEKKLPSEHKEITHTRALLGRLKRTAIKG